MTDHRPDHDGDIASIRASLAALAEEERRGDAGPRVEAALLDAWDTAHRPARRRGRQAWLLAAAAAIVLAVTASWRLVDRDGPAVLTSEAGPMGSGGPADGSLGETTTGVHAGPSSGTAATPGDDPTLGHLPFTGGERHTIALVGGPLVTGEPLQILHMRVDRETLASMGLRSLSFPDAAMVDIEMLVGEDGVARGIRVGE